MPQQGGYSGPGGTQQFGQPGPYGQQPPGFPGGPGGEPPKKKTGLIVGLSIAAVAVIGGVVALILILSGGDDEQNADGGDNNSGNQQSTAPQVPGAGGDSSDSGESSESSDDGDSGSSGDDTAAVQELADQALEALNNKDGALAKEISCNPGAVSTDDFDQLPDGVEYSLNGDPEITGDSADIPVTISYRGQSQDETLPASKEDGTWCMAG
ncbi:hypothetical protein DI005_05830 [Prauserella sp. PE36]|uniref:Uncharacterized protein n=1 Tax=Prauserella endophytica TaxID=1592324 RepID=A0ABY2S5W8_9PSEU|nr:MULTISPECIES: hypothetical protein [Prauserella]PXY30201.1 hypothetical protein BAY59_13385 [Prauserella coralliicola]RBM22657.1 hypothetical protein DI005_05830 [Prauserella sp. PE36]TKG71269.1 hypothetical protein FCN18_14295 [Prauserella endophytica]